MERNRASFDALAYFKEMGEHNKLAQENNFYVGFSSGPDALDIIMSEYRDYANFILIDDTTAANTFCSKPGWFDRNDYTVWILAGYDYQDEESYKRALNLCRVIFRQFLSRMIHDKAELVYGNALTFLHTEQVYSMEFGRRSFNGATGIMFKVNNDEAADLRYNEEEWQ
jgi:hypothetical protein